MAIDHPTAWPLGDWVHRQADRHGERNALTFRGETLSYAAFAGRIDRFVHGLVQQLDLKPGDRIAYIGRNHPDLLALVFAAARLSLIVVPINWRLAPPEHQTILADAEPAALIAEEAFAERFEAFAANGMSSRLIASDFSKQGWLPIDELLSSGGDHVNPFGGANPTGGASSALLIVYTSGTTGLAKGAVLTQDAVRWNAANSVDMHRITGADRILSALPLFHVGGLNIQTLPAFAMGAEVLLEAHFDPGEALEIIVESKPAHTVLVPAMMRALIGHPAFEGADLSSLRQIATGSSLVPTALIQVFHDRNIPVTQVYGTTETAPIAVYQRVDDAFSTIGSAGKVGKHGEMRVISEDGKVAEVGVPGEIQIRGPQVMSGYWNNASATDEAFHEDWFRTGDIGRLDDGGNLFVEARKDDLIKSGSERIYPAEIEAVLSAVSDVDEVIVVGRTDPIWGEVPVAVVQLAAGAKIDAETLLQSLNGRIARYKWPKEVRFVEAMPRSALGKVLRYRLRAALMKADDGS
ncbi:MAG: class I adenylate-forming enzyme family protein [Geminicoccaceae bacterium]